jgi:hypothetical protein
MYPNWDFWFENKPSGNPVPKGKSFTNEPQQQVPHPTTTEFTYLQLKRWHWGRLERFYNMRFSFESHSSRGIRHTRACSMYICIFTYIPM